ncbi:folate-binding protein [Persephonella sp.]|uniref:CAF17-like 4Fe-4S cluster assembly/insertion protein YgfZ n=1 Tax=Persephonella sp. TaxID=2060922 RepID=UPI0025E0BD58|nr:folate-binding protein [Persephonella sp.]
MFWAELNRFKIKVYGEKSKIKLKNISDTDDILFLHNLLTNDIKGLKKGHFNYNLRLTGSGEPVDDFFVYRDEGFFILDTNKNPEELITELSRLKLSLKVYFEPLKYRHLIISGERAQNFLEDIGFEIPEDFSFMKKENMYVAKNPLRIGKGTYEIFGNVEDVVQKLQQFKKIDEKGLEQLRIKNCIPKIGKELKKGFHPLEANILHAFSLEKGCYVGQETIARVYFRGRPPRTLVLFKTDGNLRENKKILFNRKAVGTITSLTPDKSYGLGYVLRDFAEENREFETENGKIVILKECLFKF